MNNINTIIFDLGGTLIEYAGPYQHWPELETPGFQAAYSYLIQLMPMPPFEQFRDTGFDLLPDRWQQAVKRQRNLTLPDLFADIFTKLAETTVGTTAVPPQQLTQAAAAYETAIGQQAWLVPYAQETLATLKDQGYTIGLISNTMFSGEAHRQDLRRFSLIDYFDTLLFSSDENKWKPNPEVFNHVLEALGVKAETAVYIGDDPASDVVGGHSAGLKTIYFPSSQRFPPPTTIQPNAHISSLTELPTTLTNLNKMN